MSEKIKSQNLNTSSYPIGIDLGTTNSCVAVWKNGKAEIIPNEKTVNTINTIWGIFYRDKIINR